MSSNTKELIKKYFNSLVQEFIKDPLHNQHITITFVDCIEKSKIDGDTLGKTRKSGGGSQDRTNTTWQTINGVKVPGSEKSTTTTTYFPYKYTITFLNHYEDSEKWRGTVAHEFAHLYLFSTTGNHNHDDNFYSHMEKFENWMDQKWGLTPRQDKSRDWNQHVDQSKHEERQKKECTKCGKREIPYSTDGNCFQCWQKNNKHCEETKEFNRLTGLLDNSKTLTELETNWQTIKNNSLYDSNKRTTRLFSNAHELPDEDNKTRLDKWYNNRKSHLQASQNKDNPDESNRPESNNNPTSSIPTSIKNYFTKNKVQQIILQEESWLIKYNDNTTHSIPLDDTELQELKNYLKDNNKSSLNREELDIYERSSPTNTNKDNNSNLAPTIIGISIIILIILIIMPSRKRTNKKG